MAKTKTAKQMERHLKGVANHRRIEILFLIDSEQNITLDEIVAALHANQKTLMTLTNPHYLYNQTMLCSMHEHTTS